MEFLGTKALLESVVVPKRSFVLRFDSGRWLIGEGNAGTALAIEDDVVASIRKPKTRFVVGAALSSNADLVLQRRRTLGIEASFEDNALVTPSTARVAFNHRDPRTRIHNDVKVSDHLSCVEQSMVPLLFRYTVGPCRNRPDVD